MSLPRISSVYPLLAIEGGCITVEGEQLLPDTTMASLPRVTIGNIPARVVFAASTNLKVIVPPDLEGGRTAIRVGDGAGETAYLDIGCPVATGLHQVDSPAFDDYGNLYGTYSGSRGERSSVSVFRIQGNGYRQPFVTGITNATSMAFSPDGQLYVSSRFEGCVYKVSSDGSYESVVSELGVACGIAFSDDGTMYVGDRSGTIFVCRSLVMRRHLQFFRQVSRRFTWLLERTDIYLLRFRHCRLVTVFFESIEPVLLTL